MNFLGNDQKLQNSYQMWWETAASKVGNQVWTAAAERDFSICLSLFLLSAVVTVLGSFGLKCQPAPDLSCKVILCLQQLVQFDWQMSHQQSPAGDTQNGIATLSQPHHQDVDHSHCWEWAGQAERWIATLIIQGWVGGLMVSRQTGRQVWRWAADVFSSRVIVCFLDVEKEGRRAVFRPGGSLKINRRIHWGLSFLSLRPNEVACA